MEAQKLATKMGYQNIPWLRLTEGVLLVYLVLTVLSMFVRPDFLSVTVCAVGIYVLERP